MYSYHTLFWLSANLQPWGAIMSNLFISPSGRYACQLIVIVSKPISLVSGQTKREEVRICCCIQMQVQMQATRTEQAMLRQKNFFNFQQLIGCYKKEWHVIKMHLPKSGFWKTCTQIWSQPMWRSHHNCIKVLARQSHKWFKIENIQLVVPPCG